MHSVIIHAMGSTPGPLEGCDLQPRIHFQHCLGPLKDKSLEHWMWVQLLCVEQQAVNPMGSFGSCD